MICKAGFYCPSGGDNQLLCPKGYFCPLGTVSPFPCAPLSVCPEGSYKQIHVLPFLCIGLLDFALLLVWTSSYWREPLNRLAKFISPFRSHKTREPELEAGSESHGLSVVSNGPDHVGIFPSFIEQSRQRQVEIQFRGISMRAGSSQREILRHQDGDVRAGSFLGVMGPSGSGKCRPPKGFSCFERADCLFEKQHYSTFSLEESNQQRGLFILTVVPSSRTGMSLR